MCVELFCGCFGWSAGWLDLGGRAVGFDIEHRPYHGSVPKGAELVLQDVLTLHGSQFKDAALLLASPPCTEFSYLAMPWSRAKQIGRALRGQGEFPEGYTGSRTIAEMTALFDACFRIQREASEAAGRYIPMVVENVKGAQPWVGRAQANYGSFYLWGDVRSVGGRIIAAHRVEFGAAGVRAYRSGAKVPGLNWSGSDQPGYKAEALNTTAEKRLREGQKVETYSDPRRNGGKGAHLTCQAENLRRLDDGCKVPGLNFHEHEKTGKPGRSFQSAAVDRLGRISTEGGLKGLEGKSWIRNKECDLRPSHGNSPARKAASAQIAKIPLELSRFIARSFKPEQEQSV